MDMNNYLNNINKAVDKKKTEIAEEKQQADKPKTKSMVDLIQGSYIDTLHWNPDKEEKLTGDVTRIQYVYRTEWDNDSKSYTDDIVIKKGEIQYNVRITISSDTGLKIWEFQNNDYNNAMQAVGGALRIAKLEPSVLSLAGLNITVYSPKCKNGKYGQGNPRPYAVKVNGKGSSEFEGLYDPEGNLYEGEE